MMRIVCLLAWIGVAFGWGASQAVAQTPGGDGEWKWSAHQVALEGPLTEVRFVSPDGGVTRLALSLEAGERRTLTVPMSAPWPPELESFPSAPAPEPNRPGDAETGAQGPTVEIAGDGALIAIRRESQHEDLAASTPTPWPWPFVPGASSVLPPSVLGLGIAWAWLLVAFRKRPWMAFAVTVTLGSTLGFWFSPDAETAGTPVRLIDRSPNGSVILVEAARDRLPVDLARLRGIRITGAAHPAWMGEASPGQGVRWALESPGGYLRARYEVELGARTLDPAFNGLASLEELWVQTEAGLWEAHGAWTLGEPLPGPALANTSQPPSWLLVDLPLAGSIWLGRLRPGGFSGGIASGGPSNAIDSGPRQEVWIRWAR